MAFTDEERFYLSWLVRNEINTLAKRLTDTEHLFRTNIIKKLESKETERQEGKG